MTLFRRLYCKLWTDITYSSGVFIVDIEQVNAGWDGMQVVSKKYVKEVCMSSIH